MGADLIHHAFHGQSVRTLADEHGEPWFVLNDLCAVLSIRNVGNVLNRLADDQKGSIRLTDGTPGNPNRATVNESGMWTVILRSDSPNAEPVRRWVTGEVLPSIRRTGSYSVAPFLPQDYASALRALAVEVETRAALETKVAALTPAATAWEVLIERAKSRTQTVQRAAAALDEHPQISMGRTRLFRYMADQMRWLHRDGAGRWTPYQWVRDQDLLRFPLAPGDATHWDNQVMVTPKGFDRLLRHMLAALPEPQPQLDLPSLNQIGA